MAMNEKETGQALVSIIIRTKDRPLLLRQAIASVMDQSYSNIELVVVNDGGDDVTDVIQEAKFPERIRYIAHQASRGRSAAANAGLRSATGKYVNFLDDDDLLYPDHVSRLASYLDENDSEFVYSDCEIVHYEETGDELTPKTERVLFKGIDFDHDRLYFDNYIPMMTAMFTRRLTEESGLMDESLDCLEDWDLWLRMAECTKFHRVQGATAEYRVIGERTTPFNAWKHRVYLKYREYWTIDNMMKATWPRLYQLADKNITLRNQLKKSRRDVQRLEEEKEALSTALHECRERSGHQEQ